MTNEEYSKIGDGFDFLIKNMSDVYCHKYLADDKDAYPVVSTLKSEKKVKFSPIINYAL